MSSALEWQFGGWLRALPAGVAWAALGLLALGGMALAVWLYRDTLRRLPPRGRLALTALRVAMVLLVLLCLANPAWVDRRKPSPGNRDTMTVLVDRSDSMSQQDYRGGTRLDAAGRVWKQHETEAGEAFSKINYERFAVGVQPSGNFDEALHAPAPGPETHLYAAVRHTLATTPGAIVCLTDGLDTTPDKLDDLVSEAQRRAVPLYFVAGQNRAHGGSMLNIREIKAPPSVLRQTQFTASALLQSGAGQAGVLPVELWSGGKKLASAQLALRPGMNTVPWSVPVTAGEPGAMPLEFLAGLGAQQQTASCTVRICEHTSVEVLYYQGALQWGYRFLLSALQSDPSFRLTALLNPALNVQMSTGGGENALHDLPEDARELKRYQIVVLAHVFARQLTVGQQQALVDYAKGGGGLLFIAPDTNATQQFAGSSLEQMLPVVFEPPAPGESDAAAAARSFREQMALNDAPAEDASIFDSNAHAREGKLPHLEPFVLPAGAAASAVNAVFQRNDPGAVPRFCQHAEVQGAKPGASVLAQSADGRHILLARQQFGDGFTAVLATDLLWRWKMSLPSDSHAVEKFWQQLLLSLAPPAGEGMRLVKLTESPALHAPVALRLSGPQQETPPVVEAISPEGKHQELSLRRAADDSGWETRFTPTALGRWGVAARDAEGNDAHLSFPVAEKTQTTETLNLPPDVEGMRRLAESTGGALIGDAPVFQKPPQEETVAQPVHVQPVWNSSWLLGLLLVLYGAELITRRTFKLL